MGNPPETSSARLTERAYWDAVHQASEPSSEYEKPADSGAERSAWKRAISNAILRCGGGSYGQDWFWNRLLPQFVQRGEGRSVLEVGVAPGEEVLRFRECFGYEAFGLEYSPAGAEATRRNFSRHSVNPANVIEGDLFDNDLIKRYQSQFDVVFSRGFIEHFTDPRQAILQHAQLTKPGGLVVISIPTLSGIHLAMTRILMPHQVPLHNLTIMRLREFRNLFEKAGMEQLYCGYGGGLNLLVSYTPHPAGVRRLVQSAAIKLQVLGNMAGNAGLCRGRYLNCSLVFIGRKPVGNRP